ncbi:methionyl-tRNA formyltransferase [Desulfobacterales bacterium HSG2]|nr:methionyl-tRNA formyltransferase [Desulfobacterales bacterium HSG2]
MNEKYRIVFMGTPDFSVPALNILHENAYDVALVVTQPNRPKGRGRKLHPPPVKKAALNLGYDVIQPESVRTDEFADRVTACKPDLFVVVAFGHILPQRILEIPRLGAVNIHASLLPKYRGSAPIQWVIINGEKETGVTTMFMDKGMDTGDILLSEKIEIAPDDTSATLHDRLAIVGAELLVKTLKRFEADDIQPVPQDHAQATYAPILNKKDGRIDWKKSAEALEAFIRGVTPWPGAFTFHEDKRLKIFKAVPVLTDTDEPPGTVIRSFPDELRVATGKGVLSILEIQGASGKRLLIKDFLRGYKMPPGTILV